MNPFWKSTFSEQAMRTIFILSALAIPFDKCFSQNLQKELESGTWEVDSNATIAHWKKTKTDVDKFQRTASLIWTMRFDVGESGFEIIGYKRGVLGAYKITELDEKKKTLVLSLDLDEDTTNQKKELFVQFVGSNQILVTGFSVPIVFSNKREQLLPLGLIGDWQIELHETQRLLAKKKKAEKLSDEFIERFLEDLARNYLHFTVRKNGAVSYKTPSSELLTTHGEIKKLSESTYQLGEFQFRQTANGCVCKMTNFRIAFFLRKAIKVDDELSLKYSSLLHGKWKLDRDKTKKLCSKAIFDTCPNGLEFQNKKISFLFDDYRGDENYRVTNATENGKMFTVETTVDYDLEVRDSRLEIKNFIDAKRPIVFDFESSISKNKKGDRGVPIPSTWRFNETVTKRRWDELGSDSGELAELVDQPAELTFYRNKMADFLHYHYEFVNNKKQKNLQLIRKYDFQIHNISKNEIATRGIDDSGLWIIYTKKDAD